MSDSGNGVKRLGTKCEGQADTEQAPGSEVRLDQNSEGPSGVMRLDDMFHLFTFLHGDH